MRLHGSLSSFFRLLLFTLHLSSIASAEQGAWQEFPSSPPSQRAMQRRVQRPRQFSVMEPIAKWSRMQSPPAQGENHEESRMVDFHSGLWKLLGQISMNDFSQERTGLSKRFYDYYKGSNTNYKAGISMDNLSNQKRAQQSIDYEPSLRSDRFFDRIHNSELGNTKLKDLPPEILEALEEFGYEPEPQSQKTVVKIKTESHFYQTGPENNKPVEQISPAGVTDPYYEYEYTSPQDTIFETETSMPTNMYISKPPQVPSTRAPFRASKYEPEKGELHLESGGDLPINFGSEKKIKIADGANSVLEISSESHPTKYFLSASYVDPSSPSLQVKPLPMEKLFNSELFTEGYESLENEYPSLINDFNEEIYSPQPQVAESPTAAVMNTVNKLDELFQTQNVFKLPDHPTSSVDNVASESGGTIVSESELLSHLQTRLTALTNHVDELTLLNDTNASIRNKRPVIAHIATTSHNVRDQVSVEHTETPVPIPEHVSEMVKNISDIIGTSPSEATVDAMVKHFSRIFQHAETILSQTITDEYERQTEPTPILETTRVPSLSILDSPQHVIIVYRPVLFVSHSNNSDWSKVVGQGYKPTVLNEHGETSEALTKEVMNTLGPDLLDSLKEYFAGQLGSELPTSGTRKFPDSFSEQLKERKEEFHIRGGYIVIDGQENQAPFVGNAEGEVSVHEDTEKEPLSVDLIVPQNTLRILRSQNNVPGDIDKTANVQLQRIKTSIDSSSKIAVSPEENSEQAKNVYNIIVAGGKSEVENKRKLIPILQSFEKLKNITPVTRWISDPVGENNGKKYVVKRIVKRRRKKPTKLRSKLFARKPSQLELENNERKFADHTQQQVRQKSKWRSPPQVPRLSEQQSTSTRSEEGRKNNDPPMIILEKPITDLPVDRLADLVMKLYTSGT